MNNTDLSKEKFSMPACNVVAKVLPTQPDAARTMNFEKVARTTQP